MHVKLFHSASLSGVVDMALFSHGNSNGKMPLEASMYSTSTSLASSCHKEALQVMYTLTQTTGDVGELVSSDHV